MISLFEETNIEGILGVMVPIVAIVGGISLAFGAIYLRSRERMELISRGIDVTKLDDTQRYLDFGRRRYGRRSALRSGLLWLGVGAGLLTAYYVCHMLLPESDHTVIYIGFVGLFVGLGRILAYLLEKDTPGDGNKGTL
jgi:drug/metabolite transporter (DMT)-like permease